MNIILKRSGGQNVVLRPQARLTWYPPAYGQAVEVEILRRELDADGRFVGEATSLGRFPSTGRVSIPNTPDSDKNLTFYFISYGPDGEPDVSSLEDAVQVSVPFKRETDAPEVEQIGASTQTEITLAVSGMTRFARRRRVRIAADEDMTGALEMISDAGATQLPNRVKIAREQSAGPGNVALASAGSVATGSSSLASANYAAAYAIDGSRVPVSGHYGWHSTTNAPLHWLEVDFGQARTITEIDVITQRDDFASTTPPTEADTFSLYGITAFEIQHWDGAAWQTIQAVTGNNKVWRKFTFAAITTTKIRLYITAAQDGYARVYEIEAHALAQLSQTIWVTVAHSSGANGYGPESEPQSFTFADSTDTGGSSGAGQLVPLDKYLIE